MTMKAFLPAALTAALLAAPATALQPLHENQRVYSSFYVLGVADTIRKQCDQISPRLIRAMNYIRNLEAYARGLGYDDEQIDALLDNDAEKAKLKTRIDRDLAKRGASPQTPEGYCTVGREEIAKGSQVGQLLRAN